MFLAIQQGFTMLPKSEVVILNNTIDVYQSQAATYAGPNTAFRCDNCVVNNAVLAIRGMYVENFYNSAKHSSTFISFWTPMTLLDGAIFEFSGTRNGYALGYNYASIIGMMSYSTNDNPGAYISLGNDCMFVVKDNQFANVETSLAYGQSASTSIFNAPRLVVAGTNAEIRFEDNIMRVTKTIPSLVKAIALVVSTVTAPVGTELRVIFRRNSFTFTGNFAGSAAPVLLRYDVSTSATAKALATRVSLDQTTWRDEHSATEVPIFSGTATSPQRFILSVCKTNAYGSYFETTSDYYRGVDQTSSTLSVASSCYSAVNYDVPPAVDSSVFLFCGTQSLSFSPSLTDKGLRNGLSTTRSLYVTDTRTQYISESLSRPVDSETQSYRITQSYSGHGATSSLTNNVGEESPTHSGGQSSQTHTGVLTLSKSYPGGGASRSQTRNIDGSLSRTHDLQGGESRTQTGGNNDGLSNTHSKNSDVSETLTTGATETRSKHNDISATLTVDSITTTTMSETRTVVSLAGSDTFTKAHTKTETDLRLSATHTKAQIITHTFKNLTTNTLSLAGTSRSILHERPTLTVSSISASDSGDRQQPGKMSETQTVDGPTDSHSFTHTRSQNHARTVSIVPPNLTIMPERTYPEPIVNGAPPDNIIKDLINSGEKDGNVEILTLSASSLAGGKEALIQAVRGASCRRFERLASSRALLTPSLHRVVLGGDGSVMRVLSYQEALLSSLAALGLILMVLLAVALPSGLFVAAKKMQERKQAFSGFSAQRGVASLVKEALYEVRFPATASQTIIFLAHGAAISAGMSLFRGGGDDANSVVYKDQYQYDPESQTINPSAIITLVFIVGILPLGSWLTARFIFAKKPLSNDHNEDTGKSEEADSPPHNRWLAVAVRGTGPTHQHDRKDQYVSEERADDLDVNDDSPTRRKHTDDDAPHGGPTPTKSFGLFGGSVELICHGVRPLREARVLGPIGGSDIRFNHPAAAALPFLAPCLLVLTTIIINAAGRCDLLPAASGGVYLLYAVLVCTARPLLGVSHNAVECLSSTIVGTLLLCLFFTSFSSESSFFSSFGGTGADESRLLGGGGEATLTEKVCFLLIGAISNARFPFVLARVLGVSLPAVGEVKMKRKGALRRRQHENESDDHLVGEEDNIVIALSQVDSEDSDDFDGAHTSRSSSVELDLGVPPSLASRLLSHTDDDDDDDLLASHDGPNGNKNDGSVESYQKQGDSERTDPYANRRSTKPKVVKISGGHLGILEYDPSDDPNSSGADSILEL